MEYLKYIHIIGQRPKKIHFVKSEDKIIFLGSLVAHRCGYFISYIY